MTAKPIYKLTIDELRAKADDAELMRIAAVEAGDPRTAAVHKRRRELSQARVKALLRAAKEEA